MRVAKHTFDEITRIISLYIAKIVRVAKRSKSGTSTSASLYIAKIVRVAKQPFVITL